MKIDEICTGHSDLLAEGWKQSLAVGAAASILALSPQHQKPQQRFVPPAVQQVAAPEDTSLEGILKSTAMQAGIKGVELAQFLAQCAHETGGFLAMVERGGKKWFQRYEMQFNPDLAKVLGNVKPGDGEKFKGRGFLQITGRGNYEAAEKATGLALTEKPQLLEDPAVAAKISVWYWKTRVVPKVKDFSNTAQVTRPINSKLRGLNDRIARFEDYLENVDGAR